MANNIDHELSPVVSEKTIRSVDLVDQIDPVLEKNKLDNKNNVNNNNNNVNNNNINNNSTSDKLNLCKVPEMVSCHDDVVYIDVKFDVFGAPEGISIDKNKKKIITNHTDEWKTIISNEIYAGMKKYYWQFTLNKLNENEAISFGICDEKFSKHRSCHSLALGESQGTWGFYLSSRQVFSVEDGYATTISYGMDRTFENGDTIGIFYDNSKGKIVYFHNERSLGVAFNNIPVFQKFYPCISYCDEQFIMTADSIKL